MLISSVYISVVFKPYVVFMIINVRNSFNGIILYENFVLPGYAQFSYTKKSISTHILLKVIYLHLHIAYLYASHAVSYTHL